MRLIGIFVEEVHSCGWCRGVRSVGELPTNGGAVKSPGWRGEADEKRLKSDNAQDNNVKE